VLSAFTKALLLITAAELGDKTFFIAMILAMRHPRRWVLIGAMSALAAMTIISVGMGKVLSFVGAQYIHYGEIILFLGFGLKLLYDGWKMPAQNDGEEVEEAEAEVNKAERKLGLRPTPLKMVLEACTLTFIAEWGDRTQISTIALAAANNPVGVTIGGITGHLICALIAVIAGKKIAGRISEKLVTLLGGGLFILFGAIAIFEGVS
jgi:putative Ca2+/H+ antiporter (TMEM165/GDT1 family)